MITGAARLLVVNGHRGLPLPGWDDYSIWGLDPMEAPGGRLYAYLWRNEDDSRGRPRHSLTDGITDLETLARRIIMATGCEEDIVVRAILHSLGRDTEPQACAG
jgi:hypothetical protein